MNKSIALFSSGVLVGAIGAASLLYFSDATENRLRAEILAPSSPAMAGVQKELSTIMAKLELISSGIDSLAYKAPVTKAPGAVPPPQTSMSGDRAEKPPLQDNAMNMMPAATLPTEPSSSAPPATPTATQIEQYDSIKSQLYGAANNPSVSLSELITMSNKLTPEQRKELTDEAMAMIKRGELSENQFTAKP